VNVETVEPLPGDLITIAPGVLLTVVRLAALRVAGVAGMGSTPGGVNRWLRRTPAERGIQMLIDDQTVTIDVYIVVNAECNLREVSQNVQKLVARDIEDNVGMHIGNINVHIEDVVFDWIDERERTS
jgi:uncharacterized alkaline shock family protein YloU